MSAPGNRRSRFSGPSALLCMAGAVACFHLAYTPGFSGPLRLLIAVYLVCLVQLARLKTTRQTFYTGLATGLLCVAPQLECFWRIFGPAAIPLWLVLAFWLAAFVTLIHLTLARFGTIAAACLVPFVWTGLEYFRSELYYLKFSWLNIGYVFSDWPAIPFHTFGMYGIGFLIALGAALFLILRPVYAWAGALILILLLAFTNAATTTTGKPPLHIAGVQMEFPTEREIPPALDRLLAKYPETDLLVLSEYTVDGPPPEPLTAWCRTHQRHLIVGGKDPAPNGNFYNTVFVIGPGGDVVFRQVKSVPIQFFKDGLPAPQQAVWDSPWGKIGICICYDLSYTRVTDRLIKLGAQLLIVPTMDVADWGQHQHELHALVAPVRAAEYGVPIFRLASSGISQAVNGQGRVLSRASFPGDGESLFAEFQLARSGALPIDRWIAPFSVTVVALLIVGLIGSSWFGRNTTSDAIRPVDWQSQLSAIGAAAAKTGDMAEALQIRIHGDAASPTLIYLPGLHGDWTLVGSFRRALGRRVRFVEFTYPRTLTWSLDEYAAAVEAALLENGITAGWLLGESFGSQVVWQLVARKKFPIEGVILAGGFARHPMRRAVRLAERVAGGISLAWLTRIMFGYATLARFRYRHSPETLAGVQEFIARRTELDRQAAKHRLQLIAQNDFRSLARNLRLPFFALTGAVDPIVPWMWVRPWLRRHCPALREYKIIWPADHNVLGSAAEAAADQVVNWMKRSATEAG